MTADEIREFMTKGGHIDCGDSNALKKAVLDIMEDIGFLLGFNKTEGFAYRYVFYANDISEIHMRNLYQGENVVPASLVLCSPRESTSVDVDVLKDWVDFFCCA